MSSKLIIGLTLTTLTVVITSIFIGGVYWANQDRSFQFSHINNIYLWTREAQIVAEELPITADNRTPFGIGSFSPFRTTYVITHGFLSSALYNWVISLKDALLSHEDCNVIAISWDSGSLSLSYYVVQSRVPIVGKEVAEVLKFLAANGGLKYDRVHLIGHSLGAHVSGFAGKLLNGSIAKITGLDPAGMGFNHAIPEERLDKSDAAFVDVIHTHGCETIIQTYQCYGIVHSIGDVDFWVNGGKSQPACDEGGDGNRVLEDGSQCSHSLAYVYYTESIDYTSSSSHYLARRCDSEQHFANDSCQCPLYPQYMGFNVNTRTEGDFYVRTNSLWPYGYEDPVCPAAAFTWIQIIGIFLLCIVVLFFTAALSVFVWLTYHPEDREYLSTEFFASLCLLLGSKLQGKYETLMNGMAEDMRDDS